MTGFDAIRENLNAYRYAGLMIGYLGSGNQTMGRE
jgi:hypothetical protein